MSLRSLARRTVPLPIRWRIRQARRVLADRGARVTFATRLGDGAGFPHLLCHYERPLICYPGQEARFASKRRNVELALTSIDRLVIAPGETFSFWRSVGRPTERAGFGPAAALKNGVLMEETGGAICLVSTLLYNIGLLSSTAIVERYCHSVDNYADGRYFELGRDAAVEFAYRDLRFRNEFDVPILLRAWAEADRIVAEARSIAPIDLDMAIEVSPPAYDAGGRSFQVQTRRLIRRNGQLATEELGASGYALP